MYVEWWKELTNDDRARIIIPFIETQQFARKPWKGNWEHISEKELTNFLEMCREQHKVKIDALKAEKDNR